MGQRIVIVGATGAVGEELLKILEKRDFPAKSLTLIASERSQGKRVRFRGSDVEIQGLTRFSFRNSDLAFFSAGSRVARRFAPIARDAGALVIDNSSAFRMDPEVPLVIPEINPEAVKKHKGIIANPNCTTTIMLMALAPLRSFGIRRIVAASYQAVSGAGTKGIRELEDQLLSWSFEEYRNRVLGGASQFEVHPQIFPRQIVFNLFPHVGEFLEDGSSEEELKCLNETRKIFDNAEIRVAATCVRVPVLRAHSVALAVETRKRIVPEEAIQVLKSAKGLEVRERQEDYPTPLEVSGKDNCIVGRIRKDLSVRNGLSLWVVGDQLRKGAALNAIQIAELFL